MDISRLAGDAGLLVAAAGGLIATLIAILSDTQQRRRQLSL